MLILSVLGFFVVIFLLATITVGIAWMAFVKRAAEADEALREAGELPLDDGSPLFRSDRMSTLNFWQNLLARFDLMEALRLRLTQAQLEWSVGRVTLAMLLCGTVAGLIASWFAPTAVCVLVGLVAAFAPYSYILNVRNKRFRKFREAFPDALDSLSRALRAGYPVSSALDQVASEAQEPVATELRRVAIEANLGMGWARAFETLMQRVPLQDVNLFAAAVTLHSRTGGRLSEVMSDLATTMREGLALQGEVRALAAHGKLTGAILTILPIGIAGMMMVVSPNYMVVLFSHPYGKPLIGAAILCLIAAHFIIRKLVDIKI
jgi:tight adherence protein B